jgi:hypothetical protein
MVRQRVPGFALVISTGDPAFRFEWSSPKRTMNWKLNEKLVSIREKGKKILGD